MTSLSFKHIASRALVLLFSFNILLSGIGSLSAVEHIFFDGKGRQEAIILDYLQDITDFDCAALSDMEDPKPTEGESVSIKDMFYDHGAELVFSNHFGDKIKSSAAFLVGSSSFDPEITSPPPKA